MSDRTRRKQAHPDYGLTRLVDGNYRAWWVRFYEHRKIKAHKIFCDSKYGGHEHAKAAAKKWRDETGVGLKREAPLKRGRKPSLFHPRNRTGIAGVQFQDRWQYVGEYRYRLMRWVALWREAGKFKSRSFSARKYGYRGAYLWAVRERAQRLDVKLNVHRLITPPPPARSRTWLEINKCL